jgi:hypothetical protein
MTSTGHRIHLGTGTSAQTSSMTAIGRQIDRGVSIGPAVSSMTATGRYTLTVSATVAQTSSMTAVGTQIDRGVVTGVAPGQQFSSFSANGGLKWTEQVVADTTWNELGKQEAA